MEPARPVHVHIFKDAYDKMVEQAKKYIPNETGGFIVGYVIKWNDEYHVVVTDIIPVKHSSTEVTVQFLSEGAVEVAQKIREYLNKGLYVVGWFHSHPGYHAVPSSVDLESHSIYFREFYQVGVIVDPINNELGVFTAINKRPVLIPATVWIPKKRNPPTDQAKALGERSSEGELAKIRNEPPPMAPWYKLYLEASPEKLEDYVGKFGHRVYGVTESRILSLRDRLLFIIFVMSISIAVLALVFIILTYL